MKRILIILFLLPLFAISVSADDNSILITQANKDYNDGLYEQAIELYQQVLDNGFESNELFYNLGNAYFKLNEFPSAILYYEKAKKINPSDEDILFNLDLANQRIVDKIEAVPQIFYLKWWNNLVYTFSVDGWGWISYTAFSLFFVMLITFLLSGKAFVKKTAFWLGIIFITISISAFALANQKHNTFLKDHQAIVFTPTITVKSSPSATSTDLFVIHEGTKVQIIDRVGIWYEIKIANGSVGWLTETDIKKI